MRLRASVKVVLVSDRFSSALLETGAHLYDRAFPIVVLETAQDCADAQIAELLQIFKPTQVLAIERPGSAIDGHRYSMRGVLLDDLIPGADRLLVPAGPRDLRPWRLGMAAMNSASAPYAQCICIGSSMAKRSSARHPPIMSLLPAFQTGVVTRWSLH